MWLKLHFLSLSALFTVVHCYYVSESVCHNYNVGKTGSMKQVRISSVYDLPECNENDENF